MVGAVRADKQARAALHHFSKWYADARGEHDFRMVQVPVGRFAVVGSQEADSARFAVLPGGFAATPSAAVVGKNGITRCLRAALLRYYAAVPSSHYWPSSLPAIPTPFTRTHATHL